MKEDYIARGFQKIHDDLTFLMICFLEVLEELGEDYLARNLPWINQVNVDAAPNPRLCQAYSVAFQLLNMVEENVAAQVRRARESEIGLSGEPGLWADHLRKMRELGISEMEIAGQLNKIRIEPVLTAHPTEAKRLAVLDQHRALHSLVVRRENRMWTPLEQEAIRDEIKVAGTAVAHRRSAQDEADPGRRTPQRDFLPPGDISKCTGRSGPPSPAGVGRRRLPCRYARFAGDAAPSAVWNLGWRRSRWSSVGNGPSHARNISGPAPSSDTNAGQGG